MWVRSKDKELLIDANCFYIQNSYDGKRYHIMSAIDGNETFIVGTYETKEEADEQFNKIDSALQSRGKSIFQIK